MSDYIRWCLQAGFNPPLLSSQLAKFSEDTLSSYTEVVSSQVHPLYSSFSPSPFIPPLWIEHHHHHQQHHLFFFLYSPLLMDLHRNTGLPYFLDYKRHFGPKPGALTCAVIRSEGNLIQLQKLTPKILIELNL